jgi:uncharacterized membrane protein YeaQ/YmgE (transglycosylase-associated protein family)
MRLCGALRKRRQRRADGAALRGAADNSGSHPHVSFDSRRGRAMHWLWVIIIGFLAGAIAKLFVHGPGGFIVTTLLGIVGAIFATWLGQHIGWYQPGRGAGFIGAIVGAVLILAIYRALFGNQPF